MNLKDFKSGAYKQQYQYRSFSPSRVNHSWVWDDSTINVLLEKATKALGELNAFTLIVPDVDLFIQMHIVKEANTSSRIEGTRTEIDEALMNKEDVSPERRDDWQEVHNYISAMNYAISELEKLPLSGRLLRETHAILMDNVRGEHKNPGEFRQSQNWIGGSNLSDAVYIPPHHDEIPDLMSDLENFWHDENLEVPHLIKVAISHYQFETIHPFLDGNGRIGRLLITLYLVSFGLLTKPSLYLSDFFERRRVSYYDALSRVRVSNDLAHWIKFFLNAVIETAEKGKRTFKEILALKNRIDAKIITLNRRAQIGRELTYYLYKQPLITAGDIVANLGVSVPTANDLVQSFVELGILREITGFRRNRVFEFTEYVKLFKSE